MIHYSCDRCRRVLDPDVDPRYVVNLEAYGEIEPLEVDDMDDDRDHLAEIQEILEKIDDDEMCQNGDGFRMRKYDLCSSCFKEFMKNPVGRDSVAHVGFSQN